MTQYLITVCVYSGNNGNVYILIDSVCTLNWGGWALEMLNRVNWVPAEHDKVPPMIGGAMPLLNPR